MADEPLVSPFSRPPAPPKTFTRPITPSPIATPQPITAPKPAGPVEVVENLPMGFMAGLVAAAIGAGLWALVTIVTGFQIGWMAVGVGFLVGWAVRVAGKGAHMAFGILGAALALGGCALGNLLAVAVIAARHFEVPLQAAFTRLDARCRVEPDGDDVQADPRALLRHRDLRGLPLLHRRRHRLT